MSTTTSTRKRPQCHRCHTKMQGHRRKAGRFVCPDATVSPEPSSPISERDHLLSKPSPEDALSVRSKSHSTSLPSPPLSPSSSVGASPSPVSPPAYTATPFKPPATTTWHWKNPNWQSPPHKPGCCSPVRAGRQVSLTPTEPNTEYHYEPSPLIDSGTLQSLKEEPLEDDHGYDALSAGRVHAGLDMSHGATDPLGEFTPAHSNSLSPRPWSSFSQSPVTEASLGTVLRESTPLFKVFRTRCEDIAAVTRTAVQEGKYACAIDAPSHYPGTARISREKARGTRWVLMSDQEDDLRYALDCQQRSMPGTLLVNEQWARGMGFLEVAFAGLVGGLVVACGLRYL